MNPINKTLSIIRDQLEDKLLTHVRREVLEDCEEALSKLSGIFVSFPDRPETIEPPTMPAKACYQAAQGALKIGWAIAALSRMGFQLVGPDGADSHPTVRQFLDMMRDGVELMAASEKAVVVSASPIVKMA